MFQDRRFSRTTQICFRCCKEENQHSFLHEEWPLDEPSSRLDIWVTIWQSRRERGLPRAPNLVRDLKSRNSLNSSKASSELRRVWGIKGLLVEFVTSSCLEFTWFNSAGFVFSLLYFRFVLGSVVDQYVTRKEWYDFFLVSQSVRQGTVTPTHYNVIHDTTGLKPDHMQRLTYKLTHLYYNWPVSQSLCFVGDV